MDVVTFGETMVLLAAVESGPLRFANTFTRHAAGTESNVAIGLARLGHSAAWFSRVGDDEFGQHVTNLIRGEGVDTTRVIVDSTAPTGIVFKEKRDLGARKVMYYRAGSAASRLSPRDLDEEFIGGARFLHLTGVTLAISDTARSAAFAAARLAHERGVRVTFDPNMRLRLWTREDAMRIMRELLPLCDVVLPGHDEATMLTGIDDADGAADAIRALGPSVVALKLGAEGALVVGPDERARVPGLRLERIVDPVGAGDGFAAGFLAGQLRGWSLTRSAQLGNTVGAFAMTVVGDTEGLPTSRDIEEFRLDIDVAR